MIHTISNPHKVNYKMYILIIAISLLTLTPTVIIPLACNDICDTFEALLEVVKNLSYGCIASTVVALIIDCVNTKNLNKKANATYDAVYIDLKFSIGHLVGTWAEICSILYKDKDYSTESLTWREWYDTTKSHFHAEEKEKQERHLRFLKDQLLYSARYANSAIEKIYAQQYFLTANDIMNQDLKTILSDFKFEVRALEEYLSCDNEDFEKNLWKYLDAIASDLTQYISN